MQKGGEQDGKVVNPEICQSIVHCVFDIHQPHGTVYGRISPVVGKHTRSNFTISLMDKILEKTKRYPNFYRKARSFLRNNYPMVPYIVDLPKVEGDLREKLCIPEGAKVFGRIGGKDQFNIKTVHQAIDRLSKEDPSTYFLFANTDIFCESRSNIIHYPQITCVKEKIRFIQSCDAMIHAREMGETFGLAVAEFSSLNKPVLTCKSGDIEHVRILGDKAILYNHKDSEDVYQILRGFDKDKALVQAWNAYQDYSPEAVMKIFDEKFIQPCLT
jgi:glycosyltransferase involved in cell wall biosynthesis